MNVEQFQIFKFNINLHCKHITVCHFSIAKLLNGKEICPRYKTFVQTYCTPQDPDDLPIYCIALTS
jgi:hypothetical protein